MTAINLTTSRQTLCYRPAGLSRSPRPLSHSVALNSDKPVDTLRRDRDRQRERERERETDRQTDRQRMRHVLFNARETSTSDVVVLPLIITRHAINVYWHFTYIVTWLEKWYILTIC